MLARHLNRLAYPIRYAARPSTMSPEIAQALQNYLMIHSRAHDLPGLHHTAHHDSGLFGNAPVAASPLGLLDHLARGTLAGGHDAPGMYYDEMLERFFGGQHRNTGLESIDALMHLMRTLSGRVQSPGDVARQYSNRRIRSPEVTSLLDDGWNGALSGQGFQPGAAMGSLLHDTRTPADLRGYLNAATYHESPIHSALMLHDLTHEASRRREGQGYAADLNAGLREVFRDHIIPHLES